ncbi:MAG: putative transposase [Planctomycetota bacterium]|jgi:putative transposase
MKNALTPHLLLIAALPGWLNREQQKVLDYLREENRVLKEQLGTKKLRLTNTQRRRLAAKGWEIGRRLLGQYATILTPDTLLRWHRKLIARKWMKSAGNGRPGVMKKIEELVVQMAKDNPSWGYRRIQGALKNLGHVVVHNTDKRILLDHGIEPAPEREKKITWSQFLRSHWSTMAASDFFTTEVWTAKGLVTIYTLFVINLQSRRVHVVGSTPHPNRVFMKQAALDLAAFDDGFLHGSTHMIIDRDTKFTAEFEEILADNGVSLVKIPARSPNCNPYAERFVRSIKNECLNKMIFFGRRALDKAIRNFIEHYNAERNHQGIRNDLIDAKEMPSEGNLVRDERLGGLLSFYRRAA